MGEILEQLVEKDIQSFSRETQEILKPYENFEIKTRVLAYYKIRGSIERNLVAPTLLFLCRPKLRKIYSKIEKEQPHSHPIFAQKRYGPDGKELIVYKFRTMPEGTLQIPLYKMETVSAPKLTEFQKNLRNSGRDEYAQFHNIIVERDMQIIGLRPLMDAQYEHIQKRMASPLKHLKSGIIFYDNVHPDSPNTNNNDSLKLELAYLSKGIFEAIWKDIKICYWFFGAVKKRKKGQVKTRINIEQNGSSD